jgi:hypothetical protein
MLVIIIFVFFASSLCDIFNWIYFYESVKLIIDCLCWCKFCCQVKASVIVAETDQIQKGIVDLVVSHSIRKLVIGAETEK